MKPNPAPVPLPDSATCLVVIVASAGGVTVVSEILSKLPRNFPAAIALVQHRSPHPSHVLEDILSRATPLKVKAATDGGRLTDGTVYVAPPDQHLTVESDRYLSLSHDAKVKSTRPAGDPLFQSAAACFKERAVAVVLTGGDSDGANGVEAIKHAGGTVIAQDEETSEVFSMPRAAIETGCVDHVLPPDRIAACLTKLIQARGTA